MLRDWEKSHPGRVASIFGSMQNIAPSQLADTRLFNFENMEIDRTQARKPYDFEEATVSSSVENSVVHFIDTAN